MYGITFVKDIGSDRPCPHCSIPHRNQHSMKQSGECDGIRDGKITGTRAMQIRLRNSGKGKRKED
jgi:hypothetical protein